MVVDGCVVGVDGSDAVVDVVVACEGGRVVVVVDGAGAGVDAP